MAWTAASHFKVRVRANTVSRLSHCGILLANLSVTVMLMFLSILNDLSLLVQCSCGKQICRK